MLLLSQESCFWMEVCAWQGIGHGVGVSGHLLGGSDLRSLLVPMLYNYATTVRLANSNLIIQRH